MISTPSPTRPIPRRRGQGWTTCWVCHADQGPSEGLLCDRPRCTGTVCRRCRPRVDADTILWCPKHRPPTIIPRLLWKVRIDLHFPGRQDQPSAQDEAATFSATDFPLSYQRVVARHQLEESRWRVVAELRRFALWAASTPQPRLHPQSHPVATVLRYVHDLARTLVAHPDPRRRVTRPSTPATWLRRLSSAFPELFHVKVFTTYIAGLRTLAPAVSPYIQRGVQAQWTAATDHALTQARRSRTVLDAAVWLAMELQQRGLRPLAAARATLPQGERERRTVVVPQMTRMEVSVWECRILLDKDNPTGAVGATRRRWIPSTSAIDEVMRRLPLPYASLPDLLQRRRQLLQQQGIRQTYAARRDAAQTAEAKGQSLQQLLNHRPGSRATPGYAATTTATSLLQAMWQAHPEV